MHGQAGGTGFTGVWTTKNFQAIRADRTLQRVEWDGENGALAKLGGTPVRFRFHLTNGRLYSFWVSPSKKGASGGYLAAGGLGYAGVQDHHLATERATNLPEERIHE